MHAASVHPEPGSNSLMYCIGGHLATTIFLSGLFLEPFGSCSLTCKSLFIFFKRIFGVFVRVYISIDTVVFVVQFSRSSLPHRTACLLYHFPPPLSIPFLSFFPLFLFPVHFVHLLPFPSVNTFFEKISFFCIFFILWGILSNMEVSYGICLH